MSGAFCEYLDYSSVVAGGGDVAWSDALYFDDFCGGVVVELGYGGCGVGCFALVSGVCDSGCYWGLAFCAGVSSDLCLDAGDGVYYVWYYCVCFCMDDFVVW